MNPNHPEIIVIESFDEEVVIESDAEEKPPPGGYSSYPSILRIIINRRPRVLARSRYFQGGIFTPSKKELKECKEIIKNQLQSLETWNSICPIVGTVKVTMVFKLPRPLNDFVGNKRENGLKSTLPPWGLVPKKNGDIDNFAKLYLDAMNGIIYKDDSQVYGLFLTKTPDNVGTGQVEISVEICRHGTLSV